MYLQTTLSYYLILEIYRLLTSFHVSHWAGWRLVEVSRIQRVPELPGVVGQGDETLGVRMPLYSYGVDRS